MFQIFIAAAVVTSGNYSYEVLTDGTIRITSYNGNEKNVVVPATLDGKKVSRIRTLAFANKTELTTVTFSEGIENVEAYAFDNCTNLEKVTFPSTMLYISDLFYKKTPKITFHIPEGMEREMPQMRKGISEKRTGSLLWRKTENH